MSCVDCFDRRCPVGCRYFSGNECRHMPECVNYKDSFTEMYDNLKLENICFKTLLEQIYPNLECSGFCSKHQYSGEFECGICYPNWRKLAEAHCELKQEAWTENKELRARLRTYEVKG